MNPTERPYLLKDLPQHLPIDRSYMTIRRWVQVGVRPNGWGRGDPLVKLESGIIGGYLHSTVESYYRMVKELNQ
jgi:hypothetical protein